MSCIKNGVLYTAGEGKFRMRPGLKFVLSNPGSFGRFKQLHLVREDGRTVCGRKIPDRWIRVDSMTLEEYYNDSRYNMKCGCVYDVLERVE